jgi:hypothetical protein
MGSVMERELDFFIKNQDALVKAHRGKVLVIVDEHVAGVFDDALSAYLHAKQTFAPGTFAIQPCIAGVDAYTVSIASSNVVLGS